MSVKFRKKFFSSTLRLTFTRCEDADPRHVTAALLRTKSLQAMSYRSSSAVVIEWMSTMPESALIPSSC